MIRVSCSIVSLHVTFVAQFICSTWIFMRNLMFVCKLHIIVVNTKEIYIRHLIWCGIHYLLLIFIKFCQWNGWVATRGGGKWCFMVFHVTTLIEACIENMPYPSLFLIHFNFQLDPTRLYHVLRPQIRGQFGSK